METFLSSFLYPPPPSVVVTALSVVGLVSMATQGLSEAGGKNMRYSKFWDVRSRKDGARPAKEALMSSRAGMLLLYTPALAAALASLAFPAAGGGVRSQLVRSALCLHFFKRDFEVMFVHHYSGRIVLGTVIPITLSYLCSTVTMIYAQHLSHGAPEPAIDLKHIGAALFLVGISGNFYHHWLLAGLRKEGEKGYTIPRGGLFGLVACPHYLFEIVGFLGIACMAQTLYAFAFAVGTAFYLMGRSYATRRWYASKFQGFPEDVKALIPYVF